MENQRIRLSKTMLKNGLLSLLRDKPIGQITVTDICRVSEINRTTFYKYYGSPYDLFTEIEDDFFKDLESLIRNDPAEGVDLLVHAFQHLQENRDKVRILISSSGGDTFAEHLMQNPYLLEIFDTQIGMNYDEPAHKYARLFFIYGVLSILRSWIDDDEPESPEEIAELLFMLRKKFE